MESEIRVSPGHSYLPIGDGRERLILSLKTHTTTTKKVTWNRLDRRGGGGVRSKLDQRSFSTLITWSFQPLRDAQKLGFFLSRAKEFRATLELHNGWLAPWVHLVSEQCPSLVLMETLTFGGLSGPTDSLEGLGRQQLTQIRAPTGSMCLIRVTRTCYEEKHCHLRKSGLSNSKRVVSLAQEHTNGDCCALMSSLGANDKETRVTILNDNTWPTNLRRDPP